MSDINKTWIFSTVFSKNTKISNFMKVSPVGGEFFNADEHILDRQRGLTKIIVVYFHNVANAPKTHSLTASKRDTTNFGRLCLGPTVRHCKRTMRLCNVHSYAALVRPLWKH
jgi:hypothetical protein